MYHFIGKRVVVYLYTQEGHMIGEIRGRVADVAKSVPVAPGIKKDLALVVDIKTGDPEVPYKNSSGTENEGWFALQDIRIEEDNGPRWSLN